MLEKRIIPVLLLKDDGLVKTVRFKNSRYIGDPINTVTLFNNKEADELMVIDIGVTLEHKKPNLRLLEDIATEAFMPLAYCGGINNLADMEKVFAAGFEKVVLNSILFEKPELLTEGAKLFGSQSVVGMIDVQKSLFGKKKVFQHVNRKLSYDPVDWAKRLQDLGAGEIIVQAIYQEGTYGGYDTDLISQVSRAISVPLVAVGGASSKADLVSALKAGADAAAAGSLFIYHGTQKAVLINYPKRHDIEEILLKAKES